MTKQMMGHNQPPLTIEDFFILELSSANVVDTKIFFGFVTYKL